LLTVIVNLANAQRENPSIRKGNKLFEQKKYSQAEAKYTEAKKKNPKSLIASYNLANSQYKQNNYTGAIENLQSIEPFTKNKDTLFNIYYNQGNNYVKQAEDSLKSQNLNGAINKLQSAKSYYKLALKKNPKDYQAKYNYLLTEQLLNQLKQQQQQNQNKQQQKQDNKNQDKDKQQQNQQNQQKEKQNDKKDQKQAQIPYEEIEKMLKAVQNADQQTQQKAKLNLQKNVKTKDKNW